jgi:hypothetical protein
MRVLVVTPTSRAIAIDRLRDLFPDHQVLENTVTNAPNVIAVVDAIHEGNVPDRWAERVVAVGETLIRPSLKPHVTLPLIKAQALLEEYLKQETYSGAEEEESTVGSSV